MEEREKGGRERPEGEEELKNRRNIVASRDPPVKRQRETPLSSGISGAKRESEYY
jgi:hypothetical protein